MHSLFLKPVMLEEYFTISLSGDNDPLFRSDLFLKAVGQCAKKGGREGILSHSVAVLFLV